VCASCFHRRGRQACGWEGPLRCTLRPLAAAALLEAGAGRHAAARPRGALPPLPLAVPLPHTATVGAGRDQAVLLELHQADQPAPGYLGGAHQGEGPPV
jgi:hypothetical protein